VAKAVFNQLTEGRLMFGRKSQGFVQVYEYGCTREPAAGLDEALDQMRRRVWLWNRFVEIEHATRRRARQFLSDESEFKEIEQLRNTIAQLRGAIRERWKPERSDFHTVQELKAQVRMTQADLAALMERVKASRKERLAAAKSALRALEAARREESKQAQKESGLYWCNYDDVRHAYEIARVRVMKAGAELRAHDWNGSGKVSVRFQTGLPIPAAWRGGDGRFQLDPIPESAWSSSVRSVRRKLSRTRVRIRVASQLTGRSPVWLEIPVTIHRPMPPKGTIRAASLIRERLGTKWRYRLFITVSCDQAPAPVSRDKPSLALDIGWRLVPNGLRVAYWMDTVGGHGAVILPASDLIEFRKVDQLWSMCNEHFDQMHDSLLAWRTGKELPEPLLPCFNSVAESRSPNELLKVLSAWQTHRFAGDCAMFDQLLGWKRKHIHLWTWAVNLRDQLARKRLELYRSFAAGIVKQYETVYLERFDLRRVSRAPAPEVKAIPNTGKISGICRTRDFPTRSRERMPTDGRES
jgi:hypothetical protein